MYTLALGLWFLGHSWSMFYIRVAVPHEEARLYQYCAKHDELHRVTRLHPVSFSIYPDVTAPPSKGEPSPFDNSGLEGSTGFTLQ